MKLSRRTLLGAAAAAGMLGPRVHAQTSQPHLSGPQGSAPQVLATPNLALVFWGGFWSQYPDFVQAGTRFFVEFLRGQNVDPLSQYGISIGDICAVSSVTQPWIQKTNSDGSIGIDVANSLGMAINSGWIIQPTFQDMVYVFLQDPTLPGATVPGPGVGAQHWLSTNVPGYNQHVSFLFIYADLLQELANLATPGTTTGLTWWASQAQPYTALLSHELYETFTDPIEGTGYIDTNYPTQGYNSECCDICNDDLGKPSQQIGPWTIESYWSNQDNQCISGYVNAWNANGAPTPGLYGTPAASNGQNGLTLLFAVAQDGAFWNCASSSGAAWQRIGGAGLSGPPVVGYNATLGLLEVFAISTAANENGALWHSYQTTPNGAWSVSESLGEPPNTAIMGNVAVARNGPGAGGFLALEAFVIGADGELHHIWQLGPSQGWSGWGDSLGSPPPGIAPPSNVFIPAGGNYGGPTVGTNQDGRLEVFLLAKDGAIWHKWQVAPNSGWSGWQSLGTPPSAIQQTSASWRVGRNGDGRLELFVIGSDGNIYHIYQTAPNNGWSAWGALMPLNVPAALQFSGLPTVADAADANSPLQVFTVASDGTLWTITQAPPGQGWYPWRFLAAPNNNPLAAAQYPAVVIQPSGAATVFVLGADKNIWSLNQTTAGGPWGPLIGLGS